MRENSCDIFRAKICSFFSIFLSAHTMCLNQYTTKMYIILLMPISKMSNNKINAVLVTQQAQFNERNLPGRRSDEGEDVFLSV